jgi:O-antigen/teichoic acid export membrane protein
VTAVSEGEGGLGLRRNFSWALVGNVVYQATQWLALVVLTKLLSVTEVGLFAFALAICTPITLFSALNLRAVQVTDAQGRHHFGDFLAVQLVMSALAIVVIAYLGYRTTHRELAFLIFIVGAGQSVVVIREVFMAYCQKLERMDKVATSKVILGLSSLAALTAATWTTGSLVAGVTAMQITKLAVLVLWDLNMVGRLVRVYTGITALSYLRPRFNLSTMRGLVWLAFPLAITSVLINLMGNVPRYLIENFLGAEPLGYFAAVAALVAGGTLVVQAAGLSALPRLSVYYSEKSRRYSTLLVQLVGVGLVLGLTGIAVAMLFAVPLLTILFTPEYAAYAPLFVWTMVYGTAAYVTSFLNFGLVATRRFLLQPPILSAALAATVLSGLVLVPTYGLEGAVWSMMVGKLVQFVGTVIAISFLDNTDRTGTVIDQRGDLRPSEV